MDKRSSQYTLPLFGEPGAWEPPALPKPRTSTPEKGGAAAPPKPQAAKARKGAAAPPVDAAGTKAEKGERLEKGEKVGAEGAKGERLNTTDATVELDTLPSAEGPVAKAKRAGGDLDTLPSAEGSAAKAKVSPEAAARTMVGGEAVEIPPWRRLIAEAQGAAGAPGSQRRASPATDGEAAASAPRSSARQGRAVEEEEKVLSVADLDRRLRRVVEGATENARVAGEVSNLKAHASGHTYFTLKDEAEEAAIDCVMYRTAPLRSRRVLEDGARVVVRGRATVFVPRGRLQLLVDEAQLAGRGALLEALERLKEKLAAEGLFDPARKRALPRDAKVIGVVTSASGAAIHDIIKVAFARGAVRIVLARAPVQGRDAAPRMARALATLSKMRDVEAVIVGRGGGSADDLVAFNEEVLVREAARCRVPVVSAVGHEVDMSLLDLVADARAATPSQAAEMLVPDASARRAEIGHLALRMRRALGHKLRGERADLEKREARLFDFPRSLAERQQVVDEGLARLEKEMTRQVAQRRAELGRAEKALWSRHPRAVLASARHAIEPLAQRMAPATTKRIEASRRELEGLASRLSLALERRLAAERAELAKAAGRLSAMSPLSVLARGYAIATKDGRAVRSAGEIAAGDRLRVRLHEGAVVTEVVAVEPTSAHEPDR